VKALFQSLNLALLVGAGLLSTAQGFQARLLDASPAAIEIHAEAIPAFDPHDPARQRFGQLEAVALSQQIVSANERSKRRAIREVRMEQLFTAETVEQANRKADEWLSQQKSDVRILSRSQRHPGWARHLPFRAQDGR
jgi:hypothetical protein